jgi:hypothetical protein
MRQSLTAGIYLLSLHMPNSGLMQRLEEANPLIVIPLKCTPECDQRHFLQFNTQRVYHLEITNDEDVDEDILHCLL